MSYRIASWSNMIIFLLIRLEGSKEGISIEYAIQNRNMVPKCNHAAVHKILSILFLINSFSINVCVYEV